MEGKNKSSSHHLSGIKGNMKKKKNIYAQVQACVEVNFQGIASAFLGSFHIEPGQWCNLSFLEGRRKYSNNELGHRQGLLFPC